MGLLNSFDKSALAASSIGLGSQFALNTASGLINQAFAKRNARIQAKYNKELMQYQNELQQQNIDKQNLYNSPAQQMQRYQDAGLNPNLIYGQGSNGNQSSVPSVNSPAPASFQNTDGGFSQLNQYLDLVGKFAQVQKTINESTMTDVNSQTARWKLANLFPLEKFNLSLKNIGLGYDNTINKFRAAKASDFVDAELRYQEELANEMGYRATLQQLQTGIVPAEWEFRKQALDLANKKERVAISNMRLQNNLLTITERFERWSKDMLKRHGIIPGVNTSRNSSSSHSVNFLFGNGGSASQSSQQSKPYNFNTYGNQW